MNLQALKNIFQGNTDNYGVCANGFYQTIKSPLNDKVWLDHLNGIRRLGIIPQRDGKVKFAVIDVDNSTVAFNELIQEKLKRFQIKYVVEKSKSKGYHYWIFFKEWIDGQIVYEFLHEHFRKPYANVDVYPTSSKNPIGNFINIPYFGLNVGTADAYFVDYPKTLPEIVPVNYHEVIKPVIRESEDTITADLSENSERALRVDLSKILTGFELKKSMFCLFLPNKMTGKSASYFQNKDGIWFYKEHGRKTANGDEFALNNIEFYCLLKEKFYSEKIDRLQAIYQILEGRTSQANYLEHTQCMLRITNHHKLFKKYKNLERYIEIMADWLCQHDNKGKGEAFVSLRHLASLAGVNLTTAEHLTVITCMLGFFKKEKASYIPATDKAITVYKMLLPTEEQILDAADRLVTLKAREMKMENLLEVGFDADEVARAFLRKQKLYETTKPFMTTGFSNQCSSV